MSFPADYPGALVFPAHLTNYYQPSGHGGVPNAPRGWVLHTPEEPADDVESTPVYFAQPNRQASTHYYLDSDGDVYQLVPENCAAIANGVIGKPYPSWASPSTSLNWQSVNVEIEGYGHSIHLTMRVGGPQFNGLVRLIKHRAAAYDIPLDREHIIGHYQVSNQRSDPGPYFPWDALMAALKDSEGQGHMIRHNAQGVFWNGQTILPSAAEGKPSQSCNVNVDFNAPPDATMLRLEVLVLSGRLQVFDGDGRFAGQAKPGAFSYIDVYISPDRHIWFGGREGCVTEFIGCVGYWR